MPQGIVGHKMFLAFKDFELFQSWPFQTVKNSPETIAYLIQRNFINIALLTLNIDSRQLYRNIEIKNISFKCYP